MLDQYIKLVSAYPMVGEGGGARCDGDARALLLAPAPLFLEEAMLERHEKTLCGTIKYSLGFPKKWIGSFL